MAFLKQAFAGPFRVPTALILYAAALILSGWLHYGVEYVLETEVWGAMAPAAENTIRLARDLAVVVIAALVMPISFAMIGRDLARPLWKIGVPGEALRRFFLLWFIMNLLVVTVSHITNRLVQADSPVAGLMIGVVIILYATYIIVGAGVMYHGRFGPEDLSKALAPFVREVGQTGLMLLVALFTVLVALFTDIEVENLSWLYHAPVSAVLSALLELVVFSGAWIICMTSQETPDDDLDL